MEDAYYYLGGLVALALGVTLYRLRRRRNRYYSNASFRPHIDAAGNFMEFSMSKRPSGQPICTDRK